MLGGHKWLWEILFKQIQHLLLSVFVMELQLQFDSAQSLDDMNLFIFPEMPGSITPFHLFG